MTPLMELRDVTKVYGGGLFSKNQTAALKPLSMILKAEPSEILAVVGESGSGKTTLASLLMGFIEPTAGTVLYQGKDITRLSGAERLAFLREVQAVFQDPFAAYYPFYPVDHVLEVPIAKFKLASSKPQARTLMEDALKAVGLRPEETLGRYPHQLSGGQRQRIMVARAIMLQPRFLIADEPVSMVDASLRATILESLRNLNQQMRIPILYITHDLATAYHVADNVLVLYRGEVVESGDVETVIKNPQHDYTRLLIDSIPWPDPNRRWGERRDMSGAAV
jgi:peptide/nickel transport system ATP-binding protein